MEKNRVAIVNLYLPREEPKRNIEDSQFAQDEPEIDISYY